MASQRTTVNLSVEAMELLKLWKKTGSTVSQLIEAGFLEELPPTPAQDECLTDTYAKRCLELHQVYRLTLKHDTMVKVRQLKCDFGVSLSFMVDRMIRLGARYWLNKQRHLTDANGGI